MFFSAHSENYNTNEFEKTKSIKRLRDVVLNVALIADDLKILKKTLRRREKIAYSCNKILRPELKFPTKFYLNFSQILAIR